MLPTWDARALSPECDDALSWESGCSGAYCDFGPGDVVVHHSVAYQCRDWPEGEWCVHKGYEPGTWAGQQAWVPLGEDPVDDVEPTYEVGQVAMNVCEAGGCSTHVSAVLSNVAADDPNRQVLHELLECEEFMAPVLEQQAYAEEDRAATLECIEYARTPLLEVHMKAGHGKLYMASLFYAGDRDDFEVSDIGPE